MILRRFIAILALALILTGPALAADWVVLRLRGDVEIQIENIWVPLKRGDIVANAQLVRTLANGHAELQRDKEVVTLGSNTEIRIKQDDETGYTTVLQDFGRVEVDAEAKRVKHFEVQTPYLAAVVKGTHFIVTADPDGASVAVDRGSVAVQSVSTDRSTTVTVGQIATVKRKTDLAVSGLGPWPPILDPGMSRPKIVASLTGAQASALSLQTGATALPARFAPVSGRPVETSSGANNPGIVQVASTSSALFGFAAATGSAKADAAPSQPVSFGVVMLGALLGAVLGGLGLLFRRGI